MSTDSVIKARNLARYQRRYARHKPVKLLNRWRYLFDPPTRRDLAQCAIHGFVAYMQQLVRMRYGAKGQWGHGKYQHATKSGPGRRPIARIERIKPAGTKLRIRARRRYSDMVIARWTLLQQGGRT